jgi:CheY-like chemotaxis protein
MTSARDGKALVHGGGESMNTLTSDKATLLVVDSDPILLTGTAAVLHTAGYECHCARDTQAALKAARTLPLDLIICDVLLASESGLDLCKHIRKLPGCIDVPVMFVSSQQLPDIIRRSYEAGAAYYLRKPFDPEVLIELVSKALWMPHLVRGKLRNQAGKRFDLAGPPISAPAASAASMAGAFSP